MQLMKIMQSLILINKINIDFKNYSQIYVIIVNIFVIPISNYLPFRIFARPILNKNRIKLFVTMFGNSLVANRPK